MIIDGTPPPHIGSFPGRVADIAAQNFERYDPKRRFKDGADERQEYD
jgi:hypothetical protein